MAERHGLPIQVFTDDPGNQFGESRVQVDIAQTGFFTGHKFRAYFEFSIATATSAWLQFVSPIEFILFEQTLVLEDGSVRFAANIGGTPAGSFNTTIPVFGKNRMLTRPQPYYQSQVTIATGGTHSGGTEVDIMKVVTSSATAQRTSVGESIFQQRGLPAGTYHLKFQNFGTGTATGIYSIFWEERP